MLAAMDGGAFVVSVSGGKLVWRRLCYQHQWGKLVSGASLTRPRSPLNMHELSLPPLRLYYFLIVM
jgi:hypothetical protein